MWWLKPYLSIKVLEIEQRGTKKKDKVQDEAFGEKKFSLPTKTMCKTLMKQNKSKRIVKITNLKKPNLFKRRTANQRLTNYQELKQDNNEVSHLSFLTIKRFHLSEVSYLTGTNKEEDIF